MAAAPIGSPLDVVGTIYSLPVADIHVGERLRPVDGDWAKALGQIIGQDGQQTPIEVTRYLGKDDFAWTLVSGAHRLEAHRLRGLVYVKAIVVEGDAVEHKLREVGENLWRKGLEPLDRATFVAEMHALLLVRAGHAPDKPGRALSAGARWQRQIKEDAVDASDTVSLAYGFTDEIAQQLGLSGRTIERDILLHRRLAPSLTARLRGHPAAVHAGQLRQLAKLDAPMQRQAVELLLAGSAKTVSEAVAVLQQRPKPAADDKRLAAFIGAFSRMGLAEKKGALAQLAGLLPAGFRLAEGPEPAPAGRYSPEHELFREEAMETIDATREAIDAIVEDELLPVDRAAALEDAGRALQLTRLTIAGSGFELRGQPSPAVRAVQAEVERVGRFYDKCNRKCPPGQYDRFTTAETALAETRDLLKAVETGA